MGAFLKVFVFKFKGFANVQEEELLLKRNGKCCTGSKLLGYCAKNIFGTEYVMDLGKLNLIWWFHLRLKQIFATAPAASKNYIVASKVFNSDPKIIIYFPKVNS